MGKKRDPEDKERAGRQVACGSSGDGAANSARNICIAMIHRSAAKCRLLTSEESMSARVLRRPGGSGAVCSAMSRCTKVGNDSYNAVL